MVYSEYEKIGGLFSTKNKKINVAQYETIL
jgi:hypothetical protein